MRSGTRFTANLLNSHPRLIVTGECPDPYIIDFKKSAQRLKDLMYKTDRREIWDARGPAVMQDQLVQLWLLTSAGRSFDRFMGLNFRQLEYRFGNKTPWGEKFFEYYLDIFEESGIKLIYCLRNPFDVMHSSLNHPDVDHYINGFTRSIVFRVLFGRYKQSIQTILRLKEQYPDRVLFSQLDQVGENQEDRLSFSKSLFDFLEEPMGPEVEKFTQDWRVSNSAKQVWEKKGKDQKKPAQLSKGEIRRISRDSSMQQYRERFNYPDHGFVYNTH